MPHSASTEYDGPWFCVECGVELWETFFGLVASDQDDFIGDVPLIWCLNGIHVAEPALYLLHANPSVASEGHQTPVCGPGAAYPVGRGHPAFPGPQTGF